MKREKKPITELKPPSYPCRSESRDFDRRAFLLAIGGSSAASVLFGCKSKAPETRKEPVDRLPGKVAQPADLNPAEDTSPPDGTESRIELADTDGSKDTAPTAQRFSIPGLEVWFSDEPKLRGRPLRLSDGTRVSYAMIFESKNPVAEQTFQQKRGELMHLADRYLRDKCDYSSVATTGAQSRLAKRLNKILDKALKEEDITFIEIRFMHVQREIRKRGVAPRPINGLEDL